MRAVGRGGKTLFGEQRGKSLIEFLLILFDRQEVIAALLIKNLPCRFDLRVGGVRQDYFTHHVQLGQLLARRRNFIAARLDHRGT